MSLIIVRFWEDRDIGEINVHFFLEFLISVNYINITTRVAVAYFPVSWGTLQHSARLLGRIGGIQTPRILGYFLFQTFASCLQVTLMAVLSNISWKWSASRFAQVGFILDSLTLSSSFLCKEAHKHSASVHQNWLLYDATRQDLTNLMWTLENPCTFEDGSRIHSWIRFLHTGLLLSMLIFSHYLVQTQYQILHNVSLRLMLEGSHSWYHLPWNQFSSMQHRSSIF